MCFPASSKNCSPDELSVLELRGAGFTPHKKSTGFSAQHSEQEWAKASGSKTFTALQPNVIAAWSGRTLKVLSAFSGQEHAPKLQEGVSLQQGSLLVQVKEVDTAALGLDKVKQWPALAKETLFDIQRQSFDPVFITLPSKGTSRNVVRKQAGAFSVEKQVLSIWIPLAVPAHQESQRRSDNQGGLPFRACFGNFDAKQHSTSSLRCRRTW